jgi:transcriptional regulator with PAS, ATPase and Fis domain
MTEVLVTYGENGLGRKYTLSEECILGRHPECDIQIVDSQVSKQHARILAIENRYRIEDLQSLNGVYVNSVRIERPVDLVANDLITIGSRSYLFSPALDILPQADSNKAVLLVDQEETTSDRIALVEPEPGQPFSSLPDDFVLDVLATLIKQEPDKDIIKKIMLRLARLIEYDAAAVLITSGDNKLEPVYIVNSMPTLSISKTIAQLVVSQKKGVRVPDAVGDTVFKDGKSIIKGKIRSVITAPLLVDDKVIGVLFLTKHKPDFYSDSHLRQLLSLGAILALVVTQVERFLILRKQIEYQTERKSPLEQMHGSGPVMAEIKSTIKKVAPTPAPVLVTGETGTGKELIAKWLHWLGPGKSKPIVAVNCGALPENLVESELLGYERGAFSGAQRQKPGKLELASGGTLFLDEIGELPLGMQVKLLRALEQKNFYRLGGVKPIDVDFRLVAATHRDLEKMCRQKMFREDLFYRINVIRIDVPPLRKRPEDIETLIMNFLEQLNHDLGRNVRGIDAKALKIMKSYNWPGNIRELKNVVERLVVLSEQPVITAEQLPIELHNIDQPESADNVDNLARGVQIVERKMIIDALRKARGKKLKAAKNLGISRPTLDKKITQYDIDIFQE